MEFITYGQLMFFISSCMRCVERNFSMTVDGREIRGDLMSFRGMRAIVCAGGNDRGCGFRVSDSDGLLVFEPFRLDAC